MNTALTAGTYYTIFFISRGLTDDIRAILFKSHWGSYRRRGVRIVHMRSLWEIFPVPIPEESTYSTV
jgi:hypothetical protein